MSFQLIHEAFEQAKRDVRAGAGRLHKDRDDIDRRISGYLGAGWTGIAAESFVDAWGDWKVAATDVLEGLVGMADLLDAAHADYLAQDETSQRRLDQVSARLIERLG